MKKKKNIKKDKNKNRRMKTKNPKIVERSPKNEKPKTKKTVGLDHHTLRSAVQSHIIVQCIVGRVVVGHRLVVVVMEWVTLCGFLLIIYGENGKFSEFRLVLWTNF